MCLGFSSRLYLSTSLVNSLVNSCQYLGFRHSGGIYTIKSGKHYKSGILLDIQLLEVYQHTPGADVISDSTVSCKSLDIPFTTVCHPVCMHPGLSKINQKILFSLLKLEKKRHQKLHIE